MSSGYLTSDELHNFGFAAFGPNVLISRKASIYGADHIWLGNHVRIDDFCVLSAGDGGIVIEDRVHIATYVSMIGRGRISLGAYSGLSSRVSIYSSNDDYSGMAMTNPMVPPEYTNVRHADVSIGRHAIVGSGSIVLPGVEIGEGVAIGAMSLVKRSCEPFGIYMGVPSRRIGERSRSLLDVERKLRADRGE